MRKMKDSGVEWIGEIPKTWSTTKCKYISSFYNGFAFDSKILKTEYNYPVIRIGDIVDGGVDFSKCQGIDDNKDLKQYKVKKNDVLLAMSGATVGKIGIADEDKCAYINQRVGIIRTSFPRYLFYCLSTKSFLNYIILMASGSAQPNVSESSFGKFQIPYPSFSEQKRIANFLDSKCAEIDALTADIQSQIDTLEQYKRSLITETVTKGLNPDVEMKDSGVEFIGKIPINWNLTKLKYVGNVFNGDRGKNYPSGDDLCDEGIYFLTSNNLHSVVLDCRDEISKYISPERYKILRGAKIAYNDLIFCLRGSVGNCSINKSIHEGTIASSLMSFRVDKENPDYVNYVLQTSIASAQTSNYTNGSCAANLSAENVVRYYIPAPPLPEQKQIAIFLDSKCTEIDNIIETKKQQIETLGEYKKSLIFEYVTGKKEVPAV